MPTIIKNRLYILSLAIILFLGFYLRIYQLGRYSLWFDEAASLLNCDYMEAMVKNLGMVGDGYPSFLSNIFIYYWRNLGADEFTLRMSSVIFGVAAIIAVYQLGKCVFGKKTGLLAALILSVSPIHIYYSRELRMYSMVVLTVLLAVYFLIKALRDNRASSWAGYLLFNLLSIYIHYMTVFVLFAEVVFFLAYRRDYRSLFKKWLSVHTILFLLLIPWLINVAYLLKLLFANADKYAWVPRWAGQVSLANIFYTLKNFSAGYNATEAVYIPITIIFLFFLLLGLIKRKKADFGMLFLFCFLVPILSMYLISKIKVWYVDRYVLPSAVFYYILVANGLSRLRNSYLIPVICCILVLSGLGVKNYYKDTLPDYKTCVGVTTKKDYKQAARYVVDNFQEDDVIFHVNRQSTLPFEYYFRIMGGKRAEELKDRNILLYFKQDLGKAMPFKFVEQAVKSIGSDIAVENQKRVWLVYTSFIFDDLVNVNPGKNPDELLIRNYIENFYTRKDKKEFKEIIVYLYERKC